uniref:Phosphate-regulating neutral endopeptidase (inferred by orthology to a human protein) n=1 Tax=Strongyloides venezuelensis TaxID=75913 RepID=A0A0K0G370_STRVS
MNWGNSGSFKYNHKKGNFVKFAGEVFTENKYKNESNMFYLIIYLRNKYTKELPKDKVKNYLSEILKFGKYALSSVFMRRNIRKIEKNSDYERVQNMYTFFKEQFRLLIDEKSEINAIYVPYLNVFAINSDMVNEPSFASYFPYSLNFGYLGNTMAHQMFHGENINDIGGFKVVHRAYLKFREHYNHKNDLVEGFEQFNDEQLFFIIVGRNLCQYMSKDILEKVIILDDHVPAEIRTNVALSNYKPFSDAFNCPLNSKMNPEYKCEIRKNKK